jgi:TRAP-type C4-dicarboxylate transport system permease large subunit
MPKGLCIKRIQNKRKKILRQAATSFRSMRLINRTKNKNNIKIRKMKKIALALAVVLIAGISSGFANHPVDASKRAVAAFHADFHQARDVNWKESPKYVQVRFNLENQVMFAYYNHDGSFICLIRNILTTELPSYLRSSIKKNYKSYWVSELFKVSNEQGTTSYFIKLENGDGSLVLRSENEGEWRIYNLPDPSAKRNVTF